jgi:glutamine cyclotransferase
MKKRLSIVLMALLLIALTVLFAVCTNDNSGKSGVEPQPDAPKSIGYSIVGTYPHDTSSFTQGLIVYNGAMYEGTGNYEHSKLMKVDLKTGKIERSISLAKEYFGEGITILRDTVYQLTWQNKVVFVYTLKDFKKIKEFKIDTEGWGITTDGKELIVSDGTSSLYFYNPADFQLIRKVTITEAGSLAFNLNELEYIDGFVYANQWQAPYILKIDPVTGLIVAKSDLNEVWSRVKAKDPHADVPNGIAYDSAAKKIYVTGKLWPELYEIQFSK